MRIIEETQLDFDDVSIQPKRSSLNSRKEVNLWRTYKWTSPTGIKHELTCKALCVANMGTIATPKMAKFITPRGYLIAMEKHYSFNVLDSMYSELENMAEADGKQKTFYTDKVALSIGIRETVDVIYEMSKKHVVNIVNIDVPNGYCPKLIDRVKEVRKLLPDAAIIAGTVVTGDIVTDLIINGANFVRVGICNGSVCLTAQKTGVRRPCVSMLMECSDAAHNVKGYIMQDGGIRCPADWCKATIAGADICMSGSIFAGTDMAEGELITKWYKTDEVECIDNGTIIEYKPIYKSKTFKMYYGMSSNYAQNKFFGGTTNYRTSEGREKLIPYVGKLEDVLQDYEGGVASCMTYIGAKNFKDILRHGTFYKVNHQINDVFANCKDF